WPVRTEHTYHVSGPGQAFSLKNRTVDGPCGLVFRRVLGRFFGQCSQQDARRLGSRHSLAEHDVLGAHFLAIEFLVGVIVWTKSEPRQRYSSESSSIARVREDFS